MPEYQKGRLEVSRADGPPKKHFWMRDAFAKNKAQKVPAKKLRKRKGKS
jgi:hypothetical protein